MSESKSVHSALLIHAGAIGDFVLTLRIVDAIREQGVDHLTILGRPSVAGLGLACGRVDTVLDIDAGGYHALFTHDTDIPKHVSLALGGLPLAINMLGGPIGITRERLTSLGIGRVVEIDPRPRREWSGHITEQWLADLRSAGLDATPGPPRIRLDDTATRQARDYLRTACGWASESPLAILHPGSGSRDKCWPLESFLALNAALIDMGWHTAFLLGHVEMERFSAGDLSRIHAAAPSLVIPDLVKIAVCLAEADAFVGNDSGMSHLAAAVGTRTVAIFGPTCPRLWRPLGIHVSVLRSGGGEDDGVGNSRAHGNRDAMSTADAWPTVDAVLARLGSPHQSRSNNS